MTKREISERLLDIYDFLQMWGTGLSQNDPFEYAHSANSEEFFDEAKKVRSLLLDIASSDGELLGEIQEGYFPRKEEQKNEN